MIIPTSCISGYIGYLRHPHSKDEYTSVYLATNATKEELNIFALYPGFYADVIEIAKKIDYKYINIFTISNDSLFISDLYRLVNDLLPLKEKVTLYYPDSIFPTDINTDFRNHIESSLKIVSGVEPTFTVEYVLSDPTNDTKRIYDIIIRNGMFVIYLASYLNLTKADGLANTVEYDEVHIPYNFTIYGGLSYTDIVNNRLHDSIKKKAIANCFNSFDEAIYFQNRWPHRFAPQRLADFI